MSYSRWVGSIWYTFSSTCLINDEPTFTICSVKSYPMSHIQNNRFTILKDLFDTGNYSMEQMDELSEYMDQFVIDESPGGELYNFRIEKKKVDI